MMTIYDSSPFYLVEHFGFNNVSIGTNVTTEIVASIFISSEWVGNITVQLYNGSTWTDDVVITSSRVLYGWYNATINVQWDEAQLNNTQARLKFHAIEIEPDYYSYEIYDFDFFYLEVFHEEGGEPCEENITNTSLSAWEDQECINLTTRNQSRYKIEYDANDCGTFSNVTHYEYQTVADETCDTTPKTTLGKTFTAYINDSSDKVIFMWDNDGWEYRWVVNDSYARCRVNETSYEYYCEEYP
jgi:hypothetical protein